MTLKRPAIHPLSFAVFTFGVGAACLIPLLIWELATRPVMALNTAEPAVAALRRGVSLDAGLPLLQQRHPVDRRQPCRAVLSCGAVVRLGHGDGVSRRAAAAVPLHRLRPGADGRLRRLAQARRAPPSNASCATRSFAADDAVDDPGKPRRRRTIRRDHAACAVERAGREFTGQQALAIIGRRACATCRCFGRKAKALDNKRDRRPAAPRGSRAARRRATRAASDRRRPRGCGHRKQPRADPATGIPWRRRP